MIKTYIVTGGNRGLGYETACKLAEDHDHFVVLAGRDLERCEEASVLIRESTNNPKVEPAFLDLSDLESVREFAQSLSDKQIFSVHGLVCNAGVSNSSADKRSAQGFEMTFAINHLGHFLLTQLLLKKFNQNGRIMLVSSNAHNPEKGGGPLRPPRYEKAAWLAHPEKDPNLPADRSVAGSEAYANSKLCNVLMAYELDRQLRSLDQENGITVNAFAPGLMAGTGLGRDGQGVTRLMWYVVLPFMSRFIPTARTPQVSGEALAWLMTSPEMAGVSGQYFFGKEAQTSSADSYSEALAADLWGSSIELVQLKSEESIFSLQEG